MLACCLASCAVLAPMRASCFVGALRPALARESARARAFARRCDQISRARPFAMMQSVLVLCLALGALSLCSGSSLRVERHGLIRASTSDNAAFMLINGKSGAQEMCLVIAGACFGACARAARGGMQRRLKYARRRWRSCIGALCGCRRRRRWPGVVGDAARGAHRCVARRKMYF